MYIPKYTQLKMDFIKDVFADKKKVFLFETLLYIIFIYNLNNVNFMY